MNVSWNRRTLLAAGAGAVASSCSAPLPSVTFNVRTKFTVAIDSAVDVFDCVRRVRWVDAKDALVNYGSRFRPTFWAEAAVIELGTFAGIVFATLGNRHDGQSLWSLPTTADLYRLPPDEQWPVIASLPEMLDEIEVPTERQPFFVRFKNAQDPSSVEELEPENLAPDSGSLVKIMKTTVQVTPDPPTERVLKVLPWVQRLKNNLAGTGGIPPQGPIGERLGPLDFRMWGLP